jgi:2-isopropylmalate synthase
MLAGADRVEGTLFGNGERTGNADIMNVAMNLFTQGIDPELDFSDIESTINMYEQSTELSVHPRHPYAGSLVYTAFSGSHQDAIKKGMAKMKEHPDRWEVPYLPIDPADVGRSYDPIIRINSQSGKGGVAYILETNFGLIVPKNMQADFSKIVTKVSDENDKELEPTELRELFDKTYINIFEPLRLVYYTETSEGPNKVKVRADMEYKGEKLVYEESGSGVLDAFFNGIKKHLGIDIEIVNYTEHSLSFGQESKAITYIQIYDREHNCHFGAGISSSITKSSIRAIVSAVNKIIK